VRARFKFAVQLPLSRAMLLARRALLLKQLPFAIWAAVLACGPWPCRVWPFALATMASVRQSGSS